MKRLRVIIIEKILSWNLSKKLLLLENKFNENFFASQKTWKKRGNLANCNADYEFLKPGQTIKSDAYSQQVMRLMQAFAVGFKWAA